MSQKRTSPNNSTNTHITSTAIDLTDPSTHILSPSPTGIMSLSSFQSVGSGAIFRTTITTPTSLWSPTHLHQPLHFDFHPMSQLIHDIDKILIKQYCQLTPSTIILRLSRRPNITLTSADIRTLISPGSPIHHELLLFGLENACNIFGSTYLEPAFFPILQCNGWNAVINWLSPNNAHQHNSPHCHHPNISIPIHIDGNHWVAVGRRIITGQVVFFYANDLNNPRIETIIKKPLNPFAHRAPSGSHAKTLLSDLIPTNAAPGPCSP